MIDVEVRSSGTGPRWRGAMSLSEGIGRLGVLSCIAGLRQLVLKDWPRDGVAVVIRVRP
jgi:hypothetical protein